MTREEYEAAIARNNAILDAEKARVFGDGVPGVGVMLEETNASPPPPRSSDLATNAD